MSLEHPQPEMPSYPILPSQKATLPIIPYHFSIHPTSQNSISFLSLFKYSFLLFFYYFSLSLSLSFPFRLCPSTSGTRTDKKKKKQPARSLMGLTPPPFNHRQTKTKLNHHQTAPPPQSNQSNATTIKPKPKLHQKKNHQTQRSTH